MPYKDNNYLQIRTTSNRKPESLNSKIISTFKFLDQNSNNETANPDLIGANWKTYKDPQGLFSIKYPPDENTKVYMQEFNEKSNPRPKWLLTDVVIERTYKAGLATEDGIEPFSLSIPLN